VRAATPGEQEKQVEIEVFAQPEGLHGQPEVWVRIQTDELLDWPRYRAALNESQAKVVAGCVERPIGYHPALLEGGDANPHRYEEWFILKPLGERSSS